MKTSLFKKTEFSTRYSDNIAIIDLPVSLNGNIGIIFRQILDDIIHKNPESHLLLNFHNLETINSGNIGEMVRVIWFFQNSKRILKMCSLNTNIQKIMDILKITERIEVFNSEKEALNSFQELPIAV